MDELKNRVFLLKYLSLIKHLYLFHLVKINYLYCQFFKYKYKTNI
jgi:hypothetical protein